MKYPLLHPQPQELTLLRIGVNPRGSNRTNRRPRRQPAVRRGRRARPASLQCGRDDFGAGDCRAVESHVLGNLLEDCDFVHGVSRRAKAEEGVGCWSCHFEGVIERCVFG